MYKKEKKILLTLIFSGYWFLKEETKYILEFSCGPCSLKAHDSTNFYNKLLPDFFPLRQLICVASFNQQWPFAILHWIKVKVATMILLYLFWF